MALLALNLDDWECIRGVGRGTYATVTLQRNKKTGQEVAFKRFTLHRADERYELDFMKEISILGTLNFPSVIKFFGFAAPSTGDEMELCYAFEFMANGSLDDLLTDIQLGIPRPRFGPTERMIVIVGVAAAIWYCHHRAVRDGAVVHRDIKAGNVLLDEQMKPHLADFGFAKVITSGRPNTPCRGSWPWMAPEVMLSGNYGTKSDVYSFGMFLYEIVTGLSPFVHLQTSKEIIYAVTVKKARPAIPPPEIPIHEVIRRCWDDNPDERPSMEEVMLMLLTETVALPGADVDTVLDYIAEIRWAEA